MHVFISGASGFLGRALALRLGAAGHTVAGVDLVADRSARVVAGDIGDAGSWQRAAKGADLVIHTAAVVSNAVPFEETWRINVLGTRRVLDAAVAAGARRFVNISSVRAFSDLGFPDDVTEDHPVRTDGSPYVDTKVAGEQVVLQAHAAEEIISTIIRPGDVYGPRSRPWTLIPLELIKARRFVLPAMGRGIFSPVYIDDLVTGIVLAATRTEGEGQTFTLTGGVGVECREFFGHYVRMVGQRGPVLLPTPAAIALAGSVGGVARAARVRTEINAESMRYFTRTGTYSIQKARRVLGYAPAIGVEEGMRRTEEWLRAEGLLD